MEKEGGKRGGKFGEGMRDRLVSKVSTVKRLLAPGWMEGVHPGLQGV